MELCMYLLRPFNNNFVITTIILIEFENINIKTFNCKQNSMTVKMLYLFVFLDNILLRIYI